MCWSLAVLTVIGALLWIPGDLGLFSDEAGASYAAPDEKVTYKFVLGLKDKKLRNVEGAKALKERLRERLIAAKLLEHDFEIDKRHGEVILELITDLEKETVLDLLTARGDVELVPVERRVKVLDELRDALPDGIELVQSDVRRRGDLYLYSANHQKLEAFVSRLALSDYKIYVGPTAEEDPRDGFRTYFVKQDAPVLGDEGLGAVKISSGVYPNYYYVTAYWAQTDEPSKDGELTGQAGLTAVTARAAGGRVLLVVDGEPMRSIPAPEAIENGQLIIRLPSGDASHQLAMARRITARLASKPHPCEVVVVTTEKLR